MANIIKPLPLIWRNLRSKGAKRAVKTARTLAAFRIERALRREIGMLSSQLRIPPERVRERYFELRDNGVPVLERGKVLMQELMKIRDLAVETGLLGEQATFETRRRFLENIKNRSLTVNLEEMEEHAQQMRARGEGQQEQQALEPAA